MRRLRGKGRLIQCRIVEKKYKLTKIERVLGLVVGLLAENHTRRSLYEQFLKTQIVSVSP